MCGSRMVASCWVATWVSRNAALLIANDQVSVPRPATRRVGGEPLRDLALLEWCGQLLSDVLGAPQPAVAAKS